MKLHDTQRENLGKYFFDVIKDRSRYLRFYESTWQAIIVCFGIGHFPDFPNLRPPANKRINIMTVTLILLGVAAIALIWVYRITRKSGQKQP